jgi:tripartite-type tricarboxylate transporter receptor subunit TctC
MVKNISVNRISNERMLFVKPGTHDDQKKKLTGVIKKARSEIMAVSVTDRAT